MALDEAMGLDPNVILLGEDIAEAVYFLASDKSGKSTGNVLNVDAGNAAAFTR